MVVAITGMNSTFLLLEELLQPFSIIGMPHRLDVAQAFHHPQAGVLPSGLVQPPGLGGWNHGIGGPVNERVYDMVCNHTARV